MPDGLQLPESLWATTATPGIDCPPLIGDGKADVAIIGAGFTGLSAALHLAEQGVAATVLEAGEPGWGASGRNGGMVCPGLKIDPSDLRILLGAEAGEHLARFSGAAPDLVFDLISRHGIDCDATRAGWLTAAHSQRAVAKLEARAIDWQDMGADVSLLSRSEAAELTGSDRFHGGLLDRRGGHIQPLSYARGLAAAALRGGAKLFGQNAVRSLEPVGQKWCLKTDLGEVLAERVVVATNGYSDALWPGLAETLVPAVSSIVATEPLSDNLRATVLPEGHAVSDSKRVLNYFRLDRHGRMVFGGRGSKFEPSDLVSYQPIENDLAQLYPNLSDVPIAFRWSGQIAVTQDFLPHIHEPAPGIFVALGYCGRGIAMASAVGKALADWLVSGSDNHLPVPRTPIRRLPLAPFRLDAAAVVAGWYRVLDRLD